MGFEIVTQRARREHFTIFIYIGQGVMHGNDVEEQITFVEQQQAPITGVRQQPSGYFLVDGATWKRLYTQEEVNELVKQAVAQQTAWERMKFDPFRRFQHHDVMRGHFGGNGSFGKQWGRPEGDTYATWLRPAFQRFHD
jgi:hypothetical protein